MHPTRIQEMISRNLAFWRCDDVDHPLVGAYVGGYTHPVIYEVAQEGDWLRPDQMVAERFFDHIKSLCRITEELDIDLFMPAAPPSGVPWLEACLGMPIKVYRDSIWPHPILGEKEPLEGLHPLPMDDWIDALTNIMSDLVVEFADRYPIGMPFLRGPIDVVVGMIGTDRTCMEFYDHPEQMQRLIDVCAAAWQELSLRLQRIIPPFHGGYVCGGRWIYAPKPCTYSSEDSTSFLSMALFRHFLLPADGVIAQTFPYGFVHRHSVSRQNIAGLLAINPNWAIEITMDPTGPSVSEMLPLFRELHARRRPIVIFGLNEEEGIAELVNGVSPRGICIIVQADTMEDASRLIRIAKGLPSASYPLGA